VRIVVLAKPVPDTTGQERLGADLRVDRAGSPAVVNGNDEYALEAALKLREAIGEGTVTLLAMAPANAPEALRKALAMGADRGVLISDPALAGSDALTTARVLAAALGRLEFDLVLAGADSSDGGTGTVTPAIAALTGLPYLSYAARIEPAGARIRVRRISPVGYDLIEAPLPALIVATQALGEPRYPSLRGIMAARTKEIANWTLADLGIDPATVGPAAATNRVVEALTPPSRGAARLVREPAPAAAAEIVAFLAERRII
jgi:electron transfer flavoprotein beta subunit